MTVPATARRAGPYNGNGSTTSFSFSFKTFAAGDLLVTKMDALGVETTLVLNSDYSVTLNGDQDANPGGSITYPISGSALATGQKLTIIGDLDYEQTTDLLGGGAFNARVIEDTFDRTVIQVQQLEERLDRSMTLPVSSTASAQLPTPEANKYLGWDGVASAIVNRDGSDLVTAAAYGNWRTDVFNGTGAQTAFVLTQDPGNANNCDVAIGGVVQTAGVDFTVSGTTLTFTSAPPAGTGNVVVRYGLAIPAGITDSNLVNFVQAGTGAVTRTAQAKMRDVVSVKDFGAVGDGVTDDTAEIQAAIDSIAATGGVVYLPTGQYKISSTLTIANYGITLKGGGAAALWNGVSTVNSGGSIILKPSTMTTDAIQVTGGKFTMQDLVLLGQAGNTGDGIYLKDAQSCVIMNVCVAKMGGSGIRIGTKTGSNGNVNGWQLTNVTSQSNSQHGVLIYDQSTDIAITGPNANAGTAIGLQVANNSGEGLRIENGQFNTFIGLLSQQNLNYGVALIGTATLSLYTTFDGGDIETNVVGNWYIGGDAKHIVLTGAFPNLPTITELDPSINFAGVYTSSGARTRSIRFDKDQSQFDYYKTGTWTPTLAYSVSNGDLNYTAGYRNGVYTRIGNLVTVTLYLLFNETTASGNLTITNLPFATANLTNMLGAGAMYVDNFTGLTGAPIWQINHNGGTVMGFFDSAAGTAVAISNTNTSASNNVIRVTAQYQAA